MLLVSMVKNSKIAIFVYITMNIANINFLSTVCEYL